MDIVTTSTHLQNGALDIMADAVETGRIISVSGDSLTRFNGIYRFNYI